MAISLSLAGQVKTVDMPLKTNPIIKTDTAKVQTFTKENLVHTSCTTEQNDKDWTDYFTAILTSLVTIIALWIGYRQYKTQRYQVRLDLFERRLKIIENVRQTLTEIDKHDSGDGEKINLELFRASYRQSIYLFSNDIHQYLASIDSKIGELEGIENELKKNVSAAQDELNKKKKEAIVWLRVQRVDHESKFTEFMTLNKI